MKRNMRRVAGNPFLAWIDLAWKIGEMSMASAQVIAHRTARMAAAGPTPNARDRREFARMGQEKFDAAAESAHAIAAQLAQMNVKLGERALRNMVTGTAALLSLASSRSVGQSILRQARLARSLSGSAGTATDLSAATIRLARRGLKPVHARATANARRLGKR